VITDADIENFGGSEGGQQSALLTIQYEQYPDEEKDPYGEYDYGTSDAQINVDPETGEIDDISVNWDY
jgi:hypothetical protein